MKEIEFFKNGDYKNISQYVEEKINLLKKYDDFNAKYNLLADNIENMENKLQNNKTIKKEELDELLKLVYQTEEYYFALAFSLGVKYGEDLKKI